MKRLLGLTICMLAMAALIAGCGDSDDDALSKSEFIAQADAICKKGNKQIEAAAEKTFTSGEPTKAQLETFTEGTVVPTTETMVTQIRELKPPKDDQDQIDALLTEAQATSDKLKTDPSANRADNDPFAKTNQLAKQYGLKDCSGD